MKYAVIRLGGKQFIVKKGDKIEVERQPTPLKLDVLLYSDGKEILVGSPVIDNVSVKADVIEEKKGDKIRVARFKSKSRHRKVKGHRQPLSVVEITDVSLGGTKESTPKPKTTEKAKTATKSTEKKKTTTKSKKGVSKK